MLMLSAASEQYNSYMDDDLMPTITETDPQITNDSLDELREVLRIKRKPYVIQAPATSRFVDEQQCPEIWEVCSHLRDGITDLAVLECVQSRLSDETRRISYNCEEAVWHHIMYIMSDAVVFRLVQEPCKSIIGE